MKKTIHLNNSQASSLHQPRQSMFQWLQFGWLNPRCPISDGERQWLDERFLWLGDNVGWERLRRSQTILPTPEFLPAKLTGSDGELVEIMHRIARFMEMDGESLELKTYDDEGPMPTNQESSSDSESIENCRIVCIPDSCLGSLNKYVNELAKEIAYMFLVNDKKVSVDEEDLESLAELTAVFCGLGVILANNAILDGCWTDGHFHEWSVKRNNQLSTILASYSLVLYTIARDELSPSWIDHLRPDAKAAFKQSMDYLLVNRPSNGD